MAEPPVSHQGPVYLADPSPLTTQNLLRETATLRELINSELRVRDARLDGMDKALEIAQSYPTEIDKAVQNVKDYYDEKINALVIFFNAKIEAVVELKREHFKAIATQFTERDVRIEQATKDRQLAIDAAFQAAKEAGQEQIRSRDQAIAKSEAATTKQIDALMTLLQTTTKATDDKIDDLKSRQTSTEGQSRGSGDVWRSMPVLIGVLVGVAGLVIAYLN